MVKISKELVGASASPIILSVLCEGDNYGLRILQRVKELSKGKITWKEPSIYPVLKKLEQDGLIKSYWNVEEFKRPRKYYTILAEGVEQLQHNKDEWELVQNIFTELWSPAT